MRCYVDVLAGGRLASRQSEYRRAEIIELACVLLGDAIGHWRDGEGFGFHANRPATTRLPAATPGLQGTEMWLSIVWLLADITGLSDLTAYRPRGVHRPLPAIPSVGFPTDFGTAFT